MQGKDVQQSIDETIAPALQAYDPSLKIEPSKCEPIIVRYPGTMGACDLLVNDVPLKIRVAGADSPDHFKVDFGGAYFFDMAKLEKLEQNNLAQNFNIRGVVHCGDPRVRLLQPGTYLTCTVSGEPRIKYVKLKAMTNGNIYMYNPPGLKSKSPIPQAPLTLHKQGKPTIARGSDVEAFITQGMAINPMTRYRNLAARCPPKINLTDGKRGMCVVSVPGLTSPQRMAVWIDDAVGIRVRPLDAVVDRGRVQELAQADLNRRLKDDGNAADAVVKCHKGLIAIQWPGTFDCEATAGGKRYKLIVLVQDFKGTVSWRGIPEP